MFELNSDTRLLYLCLLTNPQRDLLPAFRVSDRMLSAYTGYSKDLIDICRRQLIASGRIYFEEGYYIFTKQDFVKPSSGRDTAKIYFREYEKLPLKVQEIVENLHPKKDEKSTGGRSGLKYIYINKDIDKTKYKSKTKEIPKEAQQLAKRLFNWQTKNYPNRIHKESAIDKWAVDIEALHRLDKQEWGKITEVIDWSQKDYFWHTNIKSGSKLRIQFDKLLDAIEDSKRAKPGTEPKAYVPIGGSGKPHMQKDAPRATIDSDAYKKFKEKRNELIKKLDNGKKNNYHGANP